jgi:hypothetical protein
LCFAIRPSRGTNIAAAASNCGLRLDLAQCEFLPGTIWRFASGSIRQCHQLLNSESAIKSILPNKNVGNTGKYIFDNRKNQEISDSVGI